VKHLSMDKRGDDFNQPRSDHGSELGFGKPIFLNWEDQSRPALSLRERKRGRGKKKKKKTE